MDPATIAQLDALCEEGWEIWDTFDRTVRERGFHPFIAADYDVVRRALMQYRAPGQRFLEFGSATGVITIMADLMGFEAYGIELDRSLVNTARDLAARHSSRAQFVAGSFLPAGYHFQSRFTDSVPGLDTSGYLQLGKALDDFDVVFGYPWNNEDAMMLDVMKRYGSPDALLLLHDTNAGVRAYRGGRLLHPPRT